MTASKFVYFVYTLSSSENVCELLSSLSENIPSFSHVGLGKLKNICYINKSVYLSFVYTAIVSGIDETVQNNLFQVYYLTPVHRALLQT